jgi:RND superfamily putative drug exporter
VIFARLAKLVVNNHASVILVWIVILFFAFPMIFSVNDVVSYQETEFLDNSYESMQAASIINEQFPSGTANSSIIIAVLDNNLTTPENRDLILSMESDIKSNSNLRYLESTTSIYDVYQASLEGLIGSLAPNIPMAEMEINTTLQMIYGIPAYYFGVWSASLGNDAVADMQTRALIGGMTATLDPANATLIWGYYGAFNGTWMSLGAVPPYSTNASLRLGHSISIAVNTTTAFLPPEYGVMMKALHGNFTVSNFTNSSAQHSFLLGMLGSQVKITNMTFLQKVYELGPSPSGTNVTALASQVVHEGTIGNYPIGLSAGISNSFLSEDNNTMLLLVSFSKSSGYKESNGAEPIVDNVKIVRQIVRQAESGNQGLKVYVTGEAPISADLSSMATNDLALIEPITISLVLILMGIFFRSILGPVIPLGSIGIALGISQAVVFIIGTYVANVHFVVVTLLIVILFGVGTDYSIFILARYREELLKGAERKDAMQTSITWAGESIATSGATVIVALGAISLSSFSMLTTMGLVLGLAVLIALLVALTLVPSIALALGGKIFWPISGERWVNFRMNYMKKRLKRRGGYFRRAARFATRHAVPIFVFAIVVSIPTTYLYFTGATSFDFIGAMGNSESVQGLNALSESFGAGLTSPTQIVITYPQEIVDSNGTLSVQMLNSMENFSVAIQGVNNNIKEVDGPSRPNGDLVNATYLASLPEIDRIVIEMQMKSYIGKDNSTVLLKVIYNEESLTPLSMDTTRAIRSEIPVFKLSDPTLATATILVGGESAGMVDVDKVTSSEFGQMEVLVIIGVFVVLLIVLGSVVLPLFAILSISLSISWTLAVTVLLFDNLLAKPVLWMLPIVIFVLLMGLGMDYNIFILTRVREESAKSKNHEKAIIEAVDRTGGIITACAIIMAGAFGSMLISNTALLQEFGFALAFAVLLDAMVVRTYITPAIMKILGPKLTWWGPKFLQRLDPTEISNEKYNDDDY